MSVFDLARRLAVRPEAKAGDVEWDGSRGWSVVRGVNADDLPRDFQGYVTEGLRRNPVAAACTREIVTSLSEAPIHAFRPTAEGEFERIPGHPAEDLFVMPNDRDSGVAFIERAAQHFIWGGNTFWRKRRSGIRTIQGLALIRPDRVASVDVDDDGVPLRWELTRKTGASEWVPADEIVHIPETDPLNEVFGMPRIISALMDLDTDNKATGYVSEVLGNYGSPGTLIMVDADKVRQQAALERAEERWGEKFGPGRGRGKVAFLPGATQVHNIGFNLKDLEFPSLRNVTREGICAAFGVDPILVGISTGARGGTMSGNEHVEARRKLWMQTVVPLIRRWEGALNAFLAPDYGDVRLFFDLSQIEALQESRSDRIERAVKMAETGSATVPEIRTEMDLDPDMDGDAVVVIKGTVKYALADTLGEEPEPEEDPAADDDAPEEDDDGGDEASEEDADDEEASWHAALLSKHRAALEVLDLLDGDGRKALQPGQRLSVLGTAVAEGKAAGVEAWKRFDDFARVQEPFYRMVADRVFARQKDETVALTYAALREDTSAGARGPAERKGVTRESLDAFRRRLGKLFDEYHAAWRSRYEDLMGQTVDAIGGRLAGTTGLSFDLRAPLIKELIADRINLIVGADRATFDAIMGAVQHGFDEGLGIPQIADRVRSVFDKGVHVGMPGVNQRFLSAAERATLIARTETTAIANAAAVRLLRQTDIPWVKMWLSQGDDRVRQAHQEEEADSEANPVPLDEEFRVTGLDAPGEPNCRCSVLFEQRQPEEGADART